MWHLFEEIRFFCKFIVHNCSCIPQFNAQVHCVIEKMCVLLYVDHTADGYMCTCGVKCVIEPSTIHLHKPNRLKYLCLHSVCPTVQSVLASVQVVEQRNRLFKVLCNSTGGRALNMTVTGPDGFNSDLNNIQPVGDPQRIGDDEFSASTDVTSGGRDGDIYQCTATNGVSSDPTDSVELRGWLENRKTF